MKRSQSQSLPRWFGLLVLSLLILSLVFGWIWFCGDCAGGDDVYYGEDQKNVVIGDKTYRRRQLSTYLVIGIDDFGAFEGSGSYNNTQQADYLALVAFDHRNNSYSVLHLDRDMMVEIDELGVNGKRTGTLVNAQLALSHTYGDGREESCLNTARAVSRALYGVPIDRYFAMTMDAVAVLNDAVGGVPVTMEADYTSLDPAFEAGATVTLTGDQALSFVRARMAVDDGTNIARMKRQKQYMDAFIARLAQTEDLEEVAKTVFRASSDLFCTNCGVSTVSNVLSELREDTSEGIYGIAGTTDISTGYTRFYADEESLRARVIELYTEN